MINHLIVLLDTKLAYLLCDLLPYLGAKISFKVIELRPK